jgi:16S rRNA (cytidine1402-2'-O)-methyltransferase
VLYIVPTPIGNLKDITYRAVEVLASCDYILCEDTRHSSTLLNHYNIKKPLKSYHQFNEASKLQPILQDLKDGRSIALISDGGTPGICDPGAMLIRACREEGLPLTALPGPSAVPTAFSLWGADSPAFQFLGFFPRKEKEAHQFLLQALHYEGITLFYESPQRIVDTLHILKEFIPDRKLLIVRELTKAFEEIIEGIPQKLIERFQSSQPKGEFVVLIDRCTENPFEGLSVQELLDNLQTTYGLSLTDAIKTAAHIRKEPKQLIYKWVHDTETADL